MSAPDRAPQLTLLGRVTLTLLACALGLSIGWSSSPSHRLDALLAFAMAISAAVVCIELLRVGPERKLWLVSVSMGGPLGFLFMYPHTRLQAFAGVASWVALSVAAVCRRRRVALWCVVVCGAVLATRALPIG